MIGAFFAIIHSFEQGRDRQTPQLERADSDAFYTTPPCCRLEGISRISIASLKPPSFSVRVSIAGKTNQSSIGSLNLRAPMVLARKLRNSQQAPCETDR